MALAEETPIVLYAGNDSLGPFPLTVGGTPISYADTAHIKAKRFTDGVGELLTEGVHYTLSAEAVLPDVGEAEQTIIAADLTLEDDQDELAEGEYLLIWRDTPSDQNLVMTAGGGLSSAAVERAFDVVLRHIQEIRAVLDRVLKINALDPAGALELLDAATRAGKFFTFDDDGNPNAESLSESLMGDQGPPGSQWYIGAGVPGSGIGVDGDIYLNASTGDVYGPKASGAWGAIAANIRGISGNGTGDMLKADNLSGLASASTARTNLGLGTAAVLAASAVFQVANNLSEGNAATMRSNLGLGTMALQAATSFILVSAIATAAQYRANTASKVLTTDQVWGAAAEVALVDGASIALDLSSGFNFGVTLGGDRALANPTNAKAGQSGLIYVTQDATGGRELTYGSNYKWAGGVAGVLSTAGDAVDRLSYYVRSSTFIELSLAKDIS